MQKTQHLIDNGAGWLLFATQTLNPATFVPERPPVLIVPGYGMNSTAFHYHPNALPFADTLAEAGFEVWTVDLRAQGQSRSQGGSTRYGLRDAICHDLPCVVRYVREHQAAHADHLDLIGCSLGGTYVYAMAGLLPELPIGKIVGMGAPLRWDSVHPLLRVAAGFPSILGAVQIRGVRRLAQGVLPIIKHVPPLLHLYIHPEIVDFSEPDKLTGIVEDPNPQLNADIARWIQNRDLFIDGINVSHAFGRTQHPLYVLTANADGVVPPATAESAYHLSASPDKTLRSVGDAATPMAHADLFVSRVSHAWVFAPLIEWLR